MSHSLLGPVMAPPEFPEHLEAAKSRRKEGTATKVEISEVIRKFRQRQGNNPDDINTEYAMNALETLGVMFELPDRPGVFCIPAHFPRKDRNEIWAEHPRKVAYVGRRVQCLREVDIFTSAFFVFFQSRVAVTVDRKAFLWKGGIKVAQVIGGEAIECLVELKNYDTVVDLVARGSQKSERHCLSFLETVGDVLDRLLKTKSPGTRTRRYLLHRPDLVARAAEPFGFSEVEVENAKRTGIQLIVSKNEANGQFVEARLDELMAIADEQRQTYSSPSDGGTAVYSPVTGGATAKQSRPCAFLCPLLRAVQKRGSSRWFALAVAMGYEDGEIAAICYEKISFSDKILAIFMKKRAEVGLEGAELALKVACVEIEPPIYETVKEELEKQL